MGKPVVTKPVTTAKPVQTTQPWGKDKCADPELFNMKVMKDTEPTDGFNNGSEATFVCFKHYAFNIPEKKKVKGRCQCAFDITINDFKCKWEFSKGNVQCSYCPRAILNGKNGVNVLGVSEWETGVAIFIRFWPWRTTTAGWH